MQVTARQLHRPIGIASATNRSGWKIGVRTRSTCHRISLQRPIGDAGAKLKREHVEIESVFDQSAEEPFRQPNGAIAQHMARLHRTNFI
jgi:hypothetical protein